MALDQERLDALWDFSDAAASEARLRAAAESESDAAARAERETQVARALGLQERFAEGHAVLDAVSSEEPAVRVRVDLERGRLLTSAGEGVDAVGRFRAAAAQWGTPEQVAWADEALSDLP